jgi:ArsR family transcriptional regulator
MHQVLHFLADPAAAVREATRLLAPEGRLLIVDFAPHDLDYLREQFAHERLGFTQPSIEQLMTEAGLTPVAYRELAPQRSKGHQTGRLTVALWLGAKTPARTTSHVRHKRIQREKAA